MRDLPEAARLGVVSFVGRRGERLILSADLSDVAREQYRRLAAALEEIQTERGIKVVMITSAVMAEGKT